MKFMYLILTIAFLTSCESKAQEEADSTKNTVEVEANIKTEKQLKRHSDSYNLKAVVTENKLDKDKLVISIDKSDYILQVLYADSVLITYPVVFGFNAIDDKKMQGDGATPEGTFKIRSKYPHRSWTYFIWFDYPNDDSQKKFAQRKKDGDIPQDAKIGGEVGIHGVPEGYDSAIDQKNNWTLGCISLKTAHIRDLYHSISDKTVIKIQK